MNITDCVYAFTFAQPAASCEYAWGARLFGLEFILQTNRRWRHRYRDVAPFAEHSPVIVNQFRHDLNLAGGGLKHADCTIRKVKSSSGSKGFQGAGCQDAVFTGALSPINILGIFRR